MGIIVTGNQAISAIRRGTFHLVNAGAYTQEELNNKVIVGVEVGDSVYNKDQEALNYWNGVKWVPTGDVYGEAEYLDPGTFTWTCPLGVQSVCVVCVGGGGAGGSTNYKVGGGGGGLGWRNDIPVTPGQNYRVVVGSGGLHGGARGGDGGDSYFRNPQIVLGGGGKSGNHGYENGGRYVGQGGGNGGQTAGANIVAHGGAGAGGYTGNGGDAHNNCAGSPGTGGGGGAGQDSGVHWGMRGNGGGGVGIYGQGPDGKGGGNVIWLPNDDFNQIADWLNYCGPAPGEGGSPNHNTGTNGIVGTDTSAFGDGGGNGNGGFPGGGGGQQEGGEPNDDTAEGTPGRGGGGAVRILWGPGRAFPDTYVNKDELPPQI